MSNRGYSSIAKCNIPRVEAIVVAIINKYLKKIFILLIFDI